MICNIFGGWLFVQKAGKKTGGFPNQPEGGAGCGRPCSSPKFLIKDTTFLMVLNA